HARQRTRRRVGGAGDGAVVRRGRNEQKARAREAARPGKREAQQPVRPQGGIAPHLHIRGCVSAPLHEWLDELLPARRGDRLLNGWRPLRLLDGGNGLAYLLWHAIRRQRRRWGDR